ncbi:MAG: sensor domain-containing diguanylate cyclase [Pseudomonadota bacterium]
MMKLGIDQSGTAALLVGAALLLMGSATIFGWLLHVPAMVEIVHGLVPMVFNTGLGFALTGVTLLVTGRNVRVVRASIGVFLICLCGLTFAEHIFDLSLGIDMAWTHQWYDYGNTRPGRMAPNTALGFMLIGAINVRLYKVDTRAAAYSIVILTFCLLTIGLTGLVGYLLAPDLLFGWSRSARMAVHTASGMIASALGIWMGWSRSDWFSGARFFTEATKVRLLGTAILIMVTTTVGLTGIVLMQKSLEKAIEGQLEAVLQSRRALLVNLTQEIAQQAHTAMRLVDAGALAAPVLSARSPGPAFSAVAQRLLDEGYAQVAIEDSRRRVLHEIGGYVAPVQFQSPIDQAGTELVWNGMPMLRARQPILKGGQTVGYLRLDRAVSAFNRTLFDVTRLGDTAELAACVHGDGALVCLPNGKNAGVFRVDLRNRPGERRLPMEYALSGKSGIIYTLDYRNQSVVAAYGPVSDRFGFVAKQDTVQAYGVIRRALEFGAPVILFVSVLGGLALYSQMDPLVTRMHQSELDAERAAAETRNLMQAVGEGIMTVDSRGWIRSINPAACSIFSYEAHELTDCSVAVLVPEELRQSYGESLAHAAAGDSPDLIGVTNLQLQGLRKDHSRFPLELTITAVRVGDERCFVGAMRDITERQQMQRQLEQMAQYDSLTGLANRNLFMNRLRLALDRSQRSLHSLALMFIDLDGFKRVNDTLGHHAGDVLLIEVAARMSAAVRNTDTVARLGGDEFMVVLEDVHGTIEQATLVAHKILAEIRRPILLDGGPVVVGASIGVVFHEGNAVLPSLDDLISQADARMYAAKQSGKNRVLAH